MTKAEWFVTLFIGFVVILVVFLFINLRIIQPYQRSVMTSLGQIQYVADPGVNITFWPFTSRHTYDVTNQVILFKDAEQMTSATKDLQDATLGVSVNYHLDQNKLKEIYLNYGDDYVEKIVKPMILDSVKSASSQYTAEELVTKRQEFVITSEKILGAKMKSIYMVLEKIAITNVKFSDSFNSAIEAKVRTQQEAEQAKNELKKAEYESQQKVTRAKAEAETIRIQAEAIQSQGGAEYVNLKAVEKWNGVLPQQFIPGQTVPFINLK